MTSHVILNVAVGEHYVKGQRRLTDALDRLGDQSRRMFWTDNWPGLVPHSAAPYGFKIDAFEAAQQAGYDQALWLDAPVYPVKPIHMVWFYLEEHGVLLLGDGWNVGQWTSDAALALYGIDRDRAIALQLCYACVVGIALTSERGAEFFRRWRALRDAGAFPGPWTNERGQASPDTRCLGHRHDQSAASWIAHDMGIAMAHLPTFLSMHVTDGDPIFRTGGL